MRRLEASNACGLYSLRLTKPLVLVGALSCECKCEQAMQRTVSLSLMGSSVRAFVCVCVCVCGCVYTRSVQESAREDVNEDVKICTFQYYNSRWQTYLELYTWRRGLFRT